MILIVAAVGRSLMAPGATEAKEYYVAPTGSDENSGSLEEPWQTLEHAVRMLAAGDTLYLRGGTYYEHEVTVSVRGTAAEPVTIQSFPGERAVIDGGVATFRQPGNGEWEVIDANRGLYRSRRRFPESSDLVRAWLVDEDVQLVAYESADNLESTNFGPLNGMEPVYMGPGLQLRDDLHLYIRLTYNPNDLSDAAGNPIAARPNDTNPNNNSLAISFSRYVLRLDGASYIRFVDLEFAHGANIMEARNGSHHITLSGCRMNYSRYGLLLRDHVHSWEISGCEFTGGVPDYIYWADVKNRGRNPTEAYPEFQSAAISGSMSGFLIHRNVFRNTFDGVTVQEGSANTRIVENVFRDVRDDSINLSRGISDVEVAHNMLWRVMSGISNLGSEREPGHVYIHHNVIDNSAYHRGGRPGNYREDNWPVWTVGSPFPDHDDGNKASWWKLYNNTIVSRQNVGHRWAAAGPDSVTGNAEKYVFNNIFYILDERVIFRNDLVSLGSHYDGNVFFQYVQEDLPLFSDFGDGGRYFSLIEFQSHSGTEWEASGLEVDPGFQLTGGDGVDSDVRATWERYTPRNEEIFTPGASYEGLDWPGIAGVNYRGAVPAP